MASDLDDSHHPGQPHTWQWPTPALAPTPHPREEEELKTLQSTGTRGLSAFLPLRSVSFIARPENPSGSRGPGEKHTAPNRMHLVPSTHRCLGCLERDYGNNVFILLSLLILLETNQEFQGLSALPVKQGASLSTHQQPKHKDTPGACSLHTHESRATHTQRDCTPGATPV